MKTTSQRVATAELPFPAPAPMPGTPGVPPMHGPEVPHAREPSGRESYTDFSGPHMVDLAPSKLVGDVMTRSLVTTGPTARLSSVAVLLRFHGISGLPVVEGTQLVGVLSEKDILRTLAEHGGLSVAAEMIDHVLEAPSQERHERRARWQGVLDRTRVKEAMTAPAVTITMDATIDSALRWMLLRHLQRLPVLEGVHLMGIITRSDILNGIEGER